MKKSINLVHKSFFAYYNYDDPMQDHFKLIEFNTVHKKNELLLSKQHVDIKVVPNPIVFSGCTVYVPHGLWYKENTIGEIIPYFSKGGVFMYFSYVFMKGEVGIFNQSFYLTKSEAIKANWKKTFRNLFSGLTVKFSLKGKQ